MKYNLVLFLSMTMYGKYVQTFRKSVSSIFSKIHFDNVIKSQVRFLAKRKSKNDLDIPEINTSPGWVTIKLGSDEMGSNAVMDDRIKQASRWASRQLSDEEAETLNESLKIEKEVFSSEKTMLKKKDTSSNNRLKDLLGKSKQGTSAEEDDLKAAARVRGFLEMNPYLCSGCGTSFQSKSPDGPGYLQKDKLQDHRLRAEAIKDKQEAIRILDMAGIDISSDAAVDILRTANIPEKVIIGVRAIGARSRRKDTASAPPLNEEIIKENIDEIVSEGSDGIEATIDSVLNRKKRLQMKKLAVDEAKLAAAATAPVASIPPSEDESVCICQRCYRLQQYGQVEQNLRPGWSSHELLTPDRFEELLSVIKDTEAVVLCVIDIFDIHGSLLSNLKSIAGSNPIVIAANKIDLLPKDVSQPRIQTWIYQTVKNYCNLKSPRDAEADFTNQIRQFGWARPDVKESGVLIKENVHLISCQKNVGMPQLMKNLYALAQDHGNKVYVMGAANVGKSSFINGLLEGNRKGPQQSSKRSSTPQATVSNLPGTTLDFIKIRLPNGITLIDTPGLINKGQLTSKLTVSELKQIIPVKPINAVTLRVSEGKCVLMGGLARIELTEGRPVFFTFYISNEVKLHPTDVDRVDEFLQKHTGTLVTPPASYERLQEFGPFDSHTFEIEGDSWKKSSKDIVIAGLGWIAVTGPGKCSVKIVVPQGTSVGTRESLMPYDAMHTTASFTGGRLSKKSSRPGAKGYGWRA